jgi:heptaprenyl diphosphate synthase
MQSRNRILAIAALFSSIAVVCYVIESFIPRPLPWFRFGFANIIVLISLYLLGFRISFTITLMKSLIGALIVGNLFSPVFLFSITGSISSVLIMSLLLSIPKQPFSPLGISIAGAVFHNLAQLAVASLLFVGLKELLFLFPAFLLISVISGSITGTIALFTLRPLSRIAVW